MKQKEYILRFRTVNRDIFADIQNGRKKIETRAATERYRFIQAHDTVVFVCGNKRFKKKVQKVQFFKSIGAILKKYRPEVINTKTHTAKEVRAMWYSFPRYKEKIKKHGLIAMTL